MLTDKDLLRRAMKEARMSDPDRNGRDRKNLENMFSEP